METPEQYSAKPKIVQIGTPNLRDVPEALRRLADQIDAGECEAAESAIVVLVDQNGDRGVYGYGAIGTTAAVVGNLFGAATMLVGKGK